MRTAARKHRVVVLLSSREKAALRRLAVVGGDVPEAAVVRALIRREARRCGVWTEPRADMPEVSNA